MRFGKTLRRGEGAVHAEVCSELYFLCELRDSSFCARTHFIAFASLQSRRTIAKSEVRENAEEGEGAVHAEVCSELYFSLRLSDSSYFSALNHAILIFSPCFHCPKPPTDYLWPISQGCLTRNGQTRPIHKG